MYIPGFTVGLERSTSLKLRAESRMRGRSVCIPPPSSETDSPLAAAAHRQ